MEIQEFPRITRDCRDMNMRQIWDLIDDELDILRRSILSLGDKIVVESFSGEQVDKVINLEHSYKKNHALVFKNSVLQLKGTDYIETDPHTITLYESVASRDIVTVLIFLNEMLVNESELVKEHIREIVNEKFEEIY